MKLKRCFCSGALLLWLPELHPALAAAGRGSSVRYGMGLYPDQSALIQTYRMRRQRSLEFPGELGQEGSGLYPFVMSGWGTGYSFRCDIVDYSWSPTALRVQFIIVTIHIGQFFFMEDCKYQFPVFLYIIMIYTCIFLLLFLHFWYCAYTKGQRLPKSAKNEICKYKDH
ncbi:Elongation of very long chain fatty acids protein 7 [Pteropus alecto]|uniref:Elongation of very long chain fatty acids protein 7 n=1 Tax=Pteropus alecto TaxID=9402 RepID=L5L1S9_PTEAL|nr:Elongation of very long chain fatty acids protein 7 [Pteropus alecto]